MTNPILSPTLAHTPPPSSPVTPSNSAPGPVTAATGPKNIAAISESVREIISNFCRTQQEGSEKGVDLLNELCCYIIEEKLNITLLVVNSLGDWTDTIAKCDFCEFFKNLKS
jgi:hypothetical protein